VSVVAQAVNYRSHARDTGSGEDPPAVFFRKSSASVSGPIGDVVRPGHVRLLDYELELGLVIGQRLAIGATVTDAGLPRYVAGLVMCNDISARDIQLEKGQFYESKSYPTFTPTGPRLVLLDSEEFRQLAGLCLRLWLNQELRQDGAVADMIIRPAAALTLLAASNRWIPVTSSSRARPAAPLCRRPRSSSKRWGICSRRRSSGGRSSPASNGIPPISRRAM
jgi:2-keto-4-pentenoate hydratase/2-oxohepta-3-ene-1,7-dioic acid hydratase in catechol pathway